MKWMLKIDGESVSVIWRDRKEAEIARRELRKVPEYKDAKLIIQSVKEEDNEHVH